MDNTIRLLSGTFSDSVSTDYLKDRISFAKKKANNFQWAKDKADYYDSFNTRQKWSEKYNRLKANYDLYNGIWDAEDYEYIQNPFGVDDFTTPTKLEHIDIISLPLREIVGSEIKRPFRFSAVAINPEAASKRRRERLSMLKDYVYQQAIAPIVEQVNAKYEQAGQSTGQPTEQPTEQDQQLEQKKKEEIDAMTPEDISRYMEKSFKLPEETLAQKLINWLIKDQNIHYKFNKGWEDSVKSAEEVYYVGIRNNRPILDVVNPLNFNYDKSPDVDFIQDGEWATYEQMLLISDVYDRYGEHLSESDRKKLDNHFSKTYTDDSELIKTTSLLIDSNASFETVRQLDRYVRVVTIVFKSLKKIKFITTINDFGDEETFVVDETYVFNPLIDIKEEIAWVEEVWKVIKIADDIYIDIGPIPNQYRSLTNPGKVKLPFYGVTYGSRNSSPVSLMDRGKMWQFAYNIIWFRLNETIATDKGNILLASLKQIPSGWKPKEWLQYLSVTKVGFIDPSQDITPVGTDPQYWKSINLSAGSDIQKYLNLLEYCEQKCIRSIGSNENRIGTVSPYETATSNQQKIIQSTNITEPEFYIHNLIKEQVMTALLEQAKIAFREDPTPVSFVLDDFSVGELTVDINLLDSAELGVFISNSTDDQFTLQQLRQQVDRIIQVSQGDLRVVAEILTSNNPAAIRQVIDEVADELQANKQQQQQIQQQQLQQQMEIEQKRIETEKAERQLDREYRLKEAYVRAMGYSNDSDVDMNQVPDILEAAKFNQDLAIKTTEVGLKNKELDIRARELTENNLSEEKDRQVKLKEIASKEKIELRDRAIKDKEK